MLCPTSGQKPHHFFQSDLGGDDGMILAVMVRLAGFAKQKQKKRDGLEG